MRRRALRAADAIVLAAILAVGLSGLDGYVALAPVLMGLAYFGLRLLPEDPGPAPDDEPHGDASLLDRRHD